MDRVVCTFSGAGPPFSTLYLMPKSSVGPPGLWLADKMKAPNDFCHLHGHIHQPEPKNIPISCHPLFEGGWRGGVVYVHGALLADECGGGGRGEQAVLGDVDAHHPVGHRDLGDDLVAHRHIPHSKGMCV